MNDDKKDLEELLRAPSVYHGENTEGIMNSDTAWRSLRLFRTGL